jgi:hypothetical protein
MSLLRSWGGNTFFIYHNIAPMELGGKTFLFYHNGAPMELG